MKKKRASIGMAALITAGTLAYLVFNKKRYYGGFQGWKRNRIHNAYFNSLDERDIAWG